MDGCDSAVRLQFDDDCALDEQVKTMLTDQLAAVPNLNELFSLNLDCLPFEFGNHCAHVDAFKETGAEHTVNLTRCAKNGSDELLGIVHAAARRNPYSALLRLMLRFRSLIEE